MMPYQVVGYIYDAEVFCPDCVVRTLVLRHPVRMSTVLMPADEALALVARHVGVDPMDETTYDSSEFPKVVFADQVESSDEVCCFCSEPLVEGLGDGWRYA